MYPYWTFAYYSIYLVNTAAMTKSLNFINFFANHSFIITAIDLPDPKKLQLNIKINRL